MPPSRRSLKGETIRQIGSTGISNRAMRMRNKAGLIAWEQRKESKEQIEYMKNRRPQHLQGTNSTRGASPLSKAEMNHFKSLKAPRKEKCKEDGQRALQGKHAGHYGANTFDEDSSDEDSNQILPQSTNLSTRKRRRNLWTNLNPKKRQPMANRYSGFSRSAQHNESNGAGDSHQGGPYVAQRTFSPTHTLLGSSNFPLSAQDSRMSNSLMAAQPSFSYAQSPYGSGPSAETESDPSIRSSSMTALSRYSPQGRNPFARDSSATLPHIPEEYNPYAVTDSHVGPHETHGRDQHVDRQFWTGQTDDLYPAASGMQAHDTSNGLFESEIASSTTPSKRTRKVQSQSCEQTLSQQTTATRAPLSERSSHLQPYEYYPPAADVDPEVDALLLDTSNGANHSIERPQATLPAPPLNANSSNMQSTAIVSPTHQQQIARLVSAPPTPPTSSPNSTQAQGVATTTAPYGAVDHRTMVPLNRRHQRAIARALEATYADYARHLERDGLSLGERPQPNDRASYAEQLRYIEDWFAVQWWSCRPDDTSPPPLRKVKEWSRGWNEWELEALQWECEEAEEEEDL